MLEQSSQGGLTVELTKSESQRDADTATHTSILAKTRICAGTCGLPISEARLKAKPSATLCVKCLEAAGDVPLLHEREKRAYRGADYSLCILDEFTERKVHIMATALPGAIREQEHLLGKANSERVRTYQEVQSLEAA
jgi:hypothetical protein